MENFLSDVWVWLLSAVAFMGGLITNFKEADSRMKAVYLIGGIAAIAVILALGHALFG